MREVDDIERGRRIVPSPTTFEEAHRKLNDGEQLWVVRGTADTKTGRLVRGSSDYEKLVNDAPGATLYAVSHEFPRAS